MHKLVRCKACGFVMKEEKLGDVCPACGVPKTAFEPYKSNVSEKRMKLLDMHAHPLILHFPQAFCIFSLFLLIFSPIFTGSLKDMLQDTYTVLAVLLPFSALAGMLTGMMDGRARFKKLKTPILKKKIILGSIFILLSLVNAVLAVLGISTLLWLFQLILLVGCAVVSAILGRLGSSLMESKLPG